MKTIYIKHPFEQTLKKFTPNNTIESLTEIPDTHKTINHNH